MSTKSVGVTDIHGHARIFHMNAGDPHTGLHVCTVHTLPTESQLQPESCNL